jgi:hypothetical protein
MLLIQSIDLWAEHAHTQITSLYLCERVKASLIPSRLFRQAEATNVPANELPAVIKDAIKYIDDRSVLLYP